jgi:hypothetical protein
MIINAQYLIAAAVNPILGAVIDRNGHIFRYILLGGFIMLIGHVMNLLLPDCDDACWLGSIPYVFYGLAYSVQVVIIYGSVPYLIKDTK